MAVWIVTSGTARLTLVTSVTAGLSPGKLKMKPYVISFSLSGRAKLALAPTAMNTRLRSRPGKSEVPEPRASANGPGCSQQWS
jgi:hypothetical protein